MSATADMLFELGTEELPPTALRRLSEALSQGFQEGLAKAGLGHAGVHLFATPRRLGLLIEGLSTAQPDQEISRRGPALNAAFKADGSPTPAAQGFAKSCGVELEALGREETDKGSWLSFRKQEPGRPATELLPAIAQQALDRLPIPKRMRWGAGEAEFVRPVHWLLFLLGDKVVPCELLGVRAGDRTFGHRFHHPGSITIKEAAAYATQLEQPGRVIADFSRRSERVWSQVQSLADSLGFHVEADADLLEEITALCEWPVAISAGFEASFLEAPQEALILTMKKNQRYFPLLDGHGRLSNRFVAVANIDSPKPELIQAGNERVVRPRLADAMFFWRQDGKESLQARLPRLGSVVFQHQLGSMLDKSERVARLARVIARRLDWDEQLAERAGLLSRCDLVTSMVFEFPEMQGIMGRYQAARDGEPEEVATALEEFYLPRFAGDRLPDTRSGIAVSLAEKLDTLMGIFGIAQRPTGDKDPFALRRAAIGALRILSERSLPLELNWLLEQAAEGLGDRVTDPEASAALAEFVLERFRGLLGDRGFGPDLFDAVVAVGPATIPDFERRIEAVREFRGLPAAESLAAANKRIRNILRKAEQAIPGQVDSGRFVDAEEGALLAALEQVEAQVAPLLGSRDYTAVLTALAALRPEVDSYFDKVLVMAEDPALRGNRLALLKRLSDLFLQVADISRLQ